MVSLAEPTVCVDGMELEPRSGVDVVTPGVAGVLSDPESTRGGV
ncbi:hypothetical protein Alvin_0406 [Allochromatium vinosum DSM 180]|uniref:Uncharacterized protein n=1 Tax=Allochromatium vinosum (strain ATCC 17899 / DSM 180 / NBRC 103801 / NCIMB 10441 / D) TaxID=572477 RepID=D3RN81_ALLVD|nr:hypothetical protein Alvin_0406 [Allochromatium vinosum DSM 180]